MEAWGQEGRWKHSVNLRKDNITVFGIGGNGTGNSCKPVRVKGSLFQIHEFGYCFFQFQMYIFN